MFFFLICVRLLLLFFLQEGSFGFLPFYIYVSFFFFSERRVEGGVERSLQMRLVKTLWVGRSLFLSWLHEEASLSSSLSSCFFPLSFPPCPSFLDLRHLIVPWHRLSSRRSVRPSTRVLVLFCLSYHRQLLAGYFADYPSQLIEFQTVVDSQICETRVSFSDFTAPVSS